MARYVVERTFPDGLAIQLTDKGSTSCQDIVARNAGVGVTWLHSYVSDDKKKAFCVYDGPDLESIQRAAERNQLPIDSITRVRVLDPYFYK